MKTNIQSTVTAARVSVRVSSCGYALLGIVTGLCPDLKAALCPDCECVTLRKRESIVNV